MSKYGDFHAILHSLLEQERQFLYQHIDSSRTRRKQGGDEVVTPLINLLILYALEQKEGPDEDKLIERLRAEDRFSSYNNTLYHSYRKVLKLIQEADGNNPITRLQHLLFVATWMRRRRILDQMPDVLKEAEEIAVEQECFQEEMKVHQHWKFLYNIVPGKIDGQRLANRIAELNAMNVQAIDLELLADELQLKKVLMNGDIQAVQGLTASHLLADIQACKSSRARIHYLRAWINIHISLKQYKEALEKISDLVELLGKQPALLSDPALSGYYYQYIFSGAQAAMALGNKEEEQRYVTLLEDGGLKAADPPKYFEYTTRIWLWRAELTGMVGKEELEHLAEILVNLKKYKSQLGEGADIIISHHSAVLLMSTGQPGKAITWMLRYQLTKTGFHRPDLVCYSYVFFVLAKFEQEEWDMVNRGKRTALTFLEKNNFHAGFYEVLLKGLAKYGTLNSATEQRTFLVALKQEIVTLLENPEFHLANSFFDQVGWLDRMIAKIN